MNAPTTVFFPADVRSVTGVDAVLASLPLSYAPGTVADGSLTVVDGADGWPAAAAEALDAGAVAVVVVHPRPADVAALRARHALVVLDSRWASNPVVPAAARACADALPRAGRIECQVLLPVGSSAEPALLDQLSLVRALVGPVTDVGVLTSSRHGYAAVGVAGGRAVDLSLVCTDAVPARASVRLLTDDGSVDLSIPSGVTARPARLGVTAADGLLLSPTLYESGHRATWRRVRALLSTPSTAGDLDDFASDGETARTAFQHAEG